MKTEIDLEGRKEDLKIILEVLEDIHSLIGVSGPNELAYGICVELYRHPKVECNIGLSCLFEEICFDTVWFDWEHYSGRLMLPVPGRYSYFQKWKGEEGELRINLLEHLIKSFKELIDE